MSAFERYIGIDYSGAETPTASLRGLRVYVAEGDTPPAEAAAAIAAQILDAARDVALFGDRSARLLRGKTAGIISRTV